MSPARTSKDVVRLRTFAEDFDRARGNTSTKTNQTPPTPPPSAKQTTQTPPPAQPEKSVSPTPKTFATKSQEPIVPETTQEEEAAIAESLAQEKRETIEVPIADEVTEFIEQPKHSILSDKSQETFDEYDAGQMGDGTIVQDRKRKRFRLFPAIGAALSQWFNTKTQELTAKEEEPTITAAKQRVETIKAAAQQRTQVPDEDYQEVAQRLQQTPRTAVAQSSGIQFKPKREVQQPQWSHTADKTSAPKPDDAPLKAPPQEETPATPSSLEGPDPVLEQSASKEVLESQTPAPESSPQTDVEEQVPQNTTTEVLPSPQPVTVQETTPVTRTPNASAKTLTDTWARYRVYTLIGVIVLAIIGGVSVSIYFFAPHSTQQQQTLHYDIPSLVQTQTQQAVPFSNDHTQLYKTILQAIQNNNSVVQVYPIINTQDGQKAAPTENLMPVLAPDAPGSFTRSAHNLTLGGVQGQPFIVMQVANYDIGFAGMLQWEKTLSADLSPLFGDPVNETFDPQSRTDTWVRSAFFKDTVVANHNVRLLADANGNTHIVYTFVNKNTIVMTTTEDALTQLLPLVQ